jgi:GTPase
VKFIDKAIITVQSGDGGKGCVSFRRERFIPRGGPDGGDGGDGGDIVIRTNPQYRTLYHFHHKKHFKAQNGKNGSGKQRTGKRGQDMIIHVPPGTIVSHAETGALLKDLVRPDDFFIVAPGGRGGLGNKRFATATNRAPRFAQPGEPGQTVFLNLELKLLADVGIVGLPNAGKSTLIGALSSATPKIGPYPFTTLIPNLGVVQTGSHEPFVVADIPGLIEGAHAGAGLGVQFLRHIERTRLIVHLIDASTIDSQSPLMEYDIVRNELSAYNENLIQKPHVIVLNKLDLPESKNNSELFLAAAKNMDVMVVSALTGNGLKKLKLKLIELLDKFHGNG